MMGTITAVTVEARRTTRERWGPGRDRHGRPVDSQKKRVYAAENVALDNEDAPIPMERWTTVAEMQRYVDRLLASAWWRRRWPSITRITINDGAGYRSATAYGIKGKIEMPRWARKEWVMLHEIAHVVVDRTIGQRAAAGHGREFCQVYLELVGHMMGDDARKALKAEFQEKKVKHTRPRKPLSAEQRAAAAERLAKARAAREG